MEDQPPGIGKVLEEAEVLFAADGRELRRVIPGAEAILVWDFRSTELRDAWDLAERLRWVQVASAGVDAVLFPELVESNVVVTNSRGVFDRPIAEYVVGLMLAFAKDLYSSFRHQQHKEWIHRETEMLHGKRLLVFGAGPIGRETARLARGLGMEVEGIGRTARAQDPDFGRVLPQEDLDEALSEADYVVIAAPLTPQTWGTFDAERLGRMKPTARLINVGRGPIVDEDALAAALLEGRIAGAALDVFREEPLPESSPLWHLPQVVVSPHMSGDFEGFPRSLGELFAENFRRWRRGAELLNIVDKKRGYTASG